MHFKTTSPSDLSLNLRSSFDPERVIFHSIGDVTQHPSALSAGFFTGIARFNIRTTKELFPKMRLAAKYKGHSSVSELFSEHLSGNEHTELIGRSIRIARQGVERVWDLDNREMKIEFFEEDFLENLIISISIWKPYRASYLSKLTVEMSHDLDPNYGIEFSPAISSWILQYLTKPSSEIHELLKSA